MALVIAGRIAPCDRDDPDAVFKGRVFIDDRGTVEQVTRGNTPAPTGFAAAPSVDAGDNLVLPGLIDLPNHLGYNTLPLWKSYPPRARPTAISWLFSVHLS